ncbi:hypothetical protein [Marinigracilibium pacificum]|uniref:Uncharacterized protein n=1 Tax=Marinigracilibium pacificum TaxID=2729599 RepID=A0A848IYH3_9BACT|nr:hypothetical protein [Marinigracilibium pacificum]NMM48686.1 hypothetical protein [Marinigracilibium pacificum]
MAKLKNIIKQLSDNDYETIYNQLMESGADKSAYLLKSMRDKSVSDTAVMDELDVNTNAYYTLRSRLNQKIEEYLLQQMENPRTDILKKVANINEVLFTKKRAIAIATLKKLEKELLDYDLASELTVVYKALKKLHINSPDHFNYSQLYNKYVAYTLAVDKAEDILAEYFKKYGAYMLSGEDTDKLALTLLNKEMLSTSALYVSHRMYVYKSCINIFHRLFVEQDAEMESDLEPIEDILDNVQKIFESYQLDTIYFHLKIVHEFLTLEYYNHYKVYRKAETYFEEVNESVENLLTNYNLFTFPSQFLLTKMDRHLRMGLENEIYDENIALFQDYESNTNDIPQYVIYMTYRSLSCHFAGKYEESARWINNLLNEVSLKKYPYAQLEVKAILALQYCIINDYDLFNQLINSIQRQIRILNKDTCEHVQILAKMMKISISEAKRDKYDKIKVLVDKFKAIPKSGFTPTSLVKMDEDFIKLLSREQ